MNKIYKNNLYIKNNKVKKTHFPEKVRMKEKM